MDFEHCSIRYFFLLSESNRKMTSGRNINKISLSFYWKRPLLTQFLLFLHRLDIEKGRKFSEERWKDTLCNCIGDNFATMHYFWIQHLCLLIIFHLLQTMQYFETFRTIFYGRDAHLDKFLSPRSSSQTSSHWPSHFYFHVHFFGYNASSWLQVSNVCVIYKHQTMNEFCKW